MFTMTELAFLRTCVLSYQNVERSVIGQDIADLQRQKVARADEMLIRISEHAGLSIEQCVAAERALATGDGT